MFLRAEETQSSAGSRKNLEFSRVDVRKQNSSDILQKYVLGDSFTKKKKKETKEFSLTRIRRSPDFTKPAFESENVKDFLRIKVSL